MTIKPIKIKNATTERRLRRSTNFGMPNRTPRWGIDWTKWSPGGGMSKSTIRSTLRSD